MGHDNYCEHGVKEPLVCVQCENDTLRAEIAELCVRIDGITERADMLCERVKVLEAQIEKLDRTKCSHDVNDWGDGCRRCNDSIQKASG